METDGETQARVKAFFDDLVKDLRPDDKNICIFAHGGLLRQFLMHLKSRNAVIPDQVFNHLYLLNLILIIFVFVRKVKIFSSKIPGKS